MLLIKIVVCKVTFRHSYVAPLKRANEKPLEHPSGEPAERCLNGCIGPTFRYSDRKDLIRLAHRWWNLTFLFDTSLGTWIPGLTVRSHANLYGPLVAKAVSILDQPLYEQLSSAPIRKVRLMNARPSVNVGLWLRSFGLLPAVVDERLFLAELT